MDCSSRGLVGVPARLHLPGPELKYFPAGSSQDPVLSSPKGEWHQAELFPRVGFFVTNLSHHPKGIVRYY